MPDPFSGGTGSTKQELNILQKEGQRNGKAQTYSPKGENAKREKEEKEKNKAEPPNVATLYKAGLEILRNAKYLVEMEAGGAHVNHRIMKSGKLKEVKGITYPSNFQPLQDIHEVDDLNTIEKHFTGSVCGKDVREFWKPLFTPQSSDSPLSSFTDRHLKMKKIQKSKEVHEVFDYSHTFDPMGRLGGRVVCTPKIWVPDEAWFDPAIRELKFSDVFTIFPPAEQEMLKLIIGRVGVGCSNHLPPGMDKPVSHTARMAAVIVGKDAGLGKSTLFNGMTAAFSKCGFVTHTFKSTEDRFGLKTAAMSDIAYKDDTSLSSLKKFLGSEETKILITNGLI